jgi:hypothetical protein
MLLAITRAPIPLAPAASGQVSPVIEAMVNLMPDYSAGRRLHDLYVNKLEGALPGNYSQLFGTGPAFRGIFFPSWQADSLSATVASTGLDDGWWSRFSIAVLCQATQDQAGYLRGQMLLDKINADVNAYNVALRAHSAVTYSAVLAATFPPFADLLRQVDRATAKQQFRDSLLANVINHQLWYQAGMWTSPEWEMFNQYAKYLALGATTAEVDALIGDLVAAGLPVPGVVGQGAWQSYAEELRDKPNIDLNDIRGACSQAVNATTYMSSGAGVSSLPNGNCFEFTANSQPGNLYRHPPGGSCFTGDTQVLDGNGQPVALRQLRRGDTVLTRDGTGTVAYVGQPLLSGRPVYRLNGGGPVFAATHPFLNATEPVPGVQVPTLLALRPGPLALDVPTLSEDGIGQLAVGSQLLSRAAGTPAPPVTVTVTEVAEVAPGPDDTYLYDVHLDPGAGHRQEFWAGRGGTFYLVAPEYPVIAQAGPSAITVVALMEGLLGSGGPDGQGWPGWVIGAIDRFGTGVFHGALAEALGSTPSFGAPPPPDPLDARISRLYAGLANADPQTGAVVASLFDGMLAALGQWLSSLVSLGWRTSTEIGGDIFAVTVFDLALTPGNPLPAEATVRLDVTVGGRASSESTVMWDQRGRANTRFHHMFDQVVHVDLNAEDRASTLTFAATINGSSIPSLSAYVPDAVGSPGHAFRSAVLRDAAGAAVGEIRFDARRLGQAAAAQELASSGLWSGDAAAAYANALGTAMAGPALSRLRALAPGREPTSAAD